jgi:N-acetylglutamate synthase-like GNAT family acetyltransferase
MAKMAISPRSTFAPIAQQGIGRALLQHVLKDAWAHGISAFHVEASTMAIPLFEKFGFEKTSFEDITVGDVKFRRQLMALK